MKIVGLIYKITNKINGKIYIGQTIHTLQRRINQHLSCNSFLISKALKKYSIDNFIIEEIYHSFDRYDLDTKEQYFISYYSCMSPFGYNLTSGGNTKKTYSEETRKKLSLAKKGKKCLKKSLSMLGHKDSLLTREKKARSLGTIPFLVIRKIDNTIVGKFSCQGICAEQLNLDYTCISRCLKKERQSHKGYLFIKELDYE